METILIGSSFRKWLIGFSFLYCSIVASIYWTDTSSFWGVMEGLHSIPLFALLIMSYLCFAVVVVEILRAVILISVAWIGKFCIREDSGSDEQN